MIYPWISGMLCFQYILTLSSMVGGMASINTAVFVPENALVGTVVARHNTSLQPVIYRLLNGNDYERFSIAERQGVVEVANPLDFQIQSTYQLQIRIDNERNLAKNASLWTLTVHVLDVSGYPPYYNKTCETPERSSGLPRLIEFTDLLLNGSSRNGLKISNKTDIVNVKKSTAYFSVTNDICEVNVTFGIKHVQDVAVAHVMSKAGVHNLTLCCVAGDNKVSAILIDRDWVREPDIPFLLPMAFSELVASKGLNAMWVDNERYSYFVLVKLGILKTATPVTIKLVLTKVMASAPYGELNFTGQTTVKLAGCPQGKYGAYCDKNCICKNDARCHGFNGACLCAPGWKGVACDIPTPAVAIDVRPEGNMYITGNVSLQCRPVHINASSMTWWFRASRNNSSKIFIQTSRNFSISPILPETNGVYTCEVTTSDGHTLERNYVLDVMECPPGLHGERCDRPCDCLHNVGCDRWAGCVCEAGWTGPTCNMSCPAGTFGTNCKQQCRCENGAECNPFNGTCICPHDLTGEYCKGKQRSPFHRTQDTLQYFTILVFILPVVVVACIVMRRKRKFLKEQHQQPVHEELQLVDVNHQQNMADTLVPWERDPQYLTLGNLVGVGTFGHVVEGTLHLPGELPVRVAVKIVDTNAEYVQADFNREMDMLIYLYDRSLHTKEGEKVMHPNIIQLYGVVTLSDPKRIILEFAPHGDLQMYLKRLRDDINAVNWATLFGLAIGVSKALQELERVTIVHRDVAARNVVITDGMVAKLADFGLARDVYTNTVYEHTNHHGRDELLPLKWMALESIRDGIYSCQSDVWSFGVMLWEIASLGEEPRYPGPFRPNCCQMVNMLRQGNRMEKPEQCSIDLYRLMCQCWYDASDHRPTAAQLEERLAELVREVGDCADDCVTVWESTV
ncbi:uncharacterized protein LOC118405570 [Branchiostoma floridae]|uniref:receptor protein-tyrosine kinase n=1 Tax=Branchiostoma floridae TaxID=7739 RepID=A0A9J7HMH2_BRAFL|nr:uncharacterized protein LOC118405570 [Branchiostoma floridae]